MPRASFYRSLDEAITSVAKEQAEARLQQQQAALSLLGSIAQARVAQQMEEQQRKAAAERKSKAFAHVRETMKGSLGDLPPTDPNFDYAKRNAIGSVIDTWDPSTSGFGADDLTEAIDFWGKLDNQSLAAAAARQGLRKGEADIAQTEEETKLLPGAAAQDQARVDIARGGLALNRKELVQRRREHDEGLAADIDKMFAGFQQQLDLEAARGENRLKAKQAGAYKADAGWLKDHGRFLYTSTGTTVTNAILASNAWNSDGGLGEVMDLKNPQDPKDSDFSKYREAVGDAVEAAVLAAKLSRPGIPVGEYREIEDRLNAVNDSMKARVKGADKGELDDPAVFRRKVQEFAAGVPMDALESIARAYTSSAEEYEELLGYLRAYAGKAAAPGGLTTPVPTTSVTAPVTLGSPWIPPPGDPFK